MQCICNITAGLLILSIKYNTRKHGIATKIKITAGTVVHATS